MRAEWPFEKALLRHLEQIWNTPDEGHLGSPRSPAALHLFQGDGMGGVRPRDQDSRNVRPRWTARPLARDAERRFTPTVCEHGFDRERGSFVQALRVKAARCEPAADAVHRFSARVRPAHSRHDRPRSSATDAGRLRAALRHAADRRWAAAGEGVFLACSFWLADAYVLLGRIDEAKRCSNDCWRCATTSACCPRSTTRRPGGCWATSRRPSRTSRSSTPR